MAQVAQRERLNVLQPRAEQEKVNGVNGTANNGSAVTGLNRQQALISELTVEEVQALRERALEERQVLEQREQPMGGRTTSLRALATPQPKRRSLRKQSPPVGERVSMRAMALPPVELVGFRNGATGVHFIDDGVGRLFFFVPGSKPDLMAIKHLFEAGEEVAGQEIQDLALMGGEQLRIARVASMSPMASRG